MTAGFIAVAGALAVPGLAQAGTLSYDAGTDVLTFTGSEGGNIVFADHPGGDTSLLRIVDVGGEETTAAGAPECELDDIEFYRVCPAPTKLVLQLNGGDDSFSDDTTGGGEPTAIPIEAFGGTGIDELDGGLGPDVLLGGSEDDRLLGGDGVDLLAGDDGADTLEGGGGSDDLAGGIGNDRLTGGQGDDAVRGGDGDDELDYSPDYILDGADLYEGGSGYDMVGYFGRAISVSVSLDGQANDGQSGEGDNVGADIEEVDGGDAADVLIGSPGPNGLAGRGGDDVISGLAGDDTILGDSGNDVISGDDGNDALDGGCHDDDITGGLGVDSLNSDGTCESPDLRGANDVLRARDGVKDALVLCTISGTAGDTAIVDPGDPALPSGNPGACRTIDVGSPAGTTPGTGTTTPGGTTTTPGTTNPGATTLAGTLRAQLGSALRLLSGNGKAGQAARQLADVKTRRAKLTLGTLVATAPARLTSRATARIRRRTVVLGKGTISVKPGAPRTLSILLSRKGKSALRRLRRVSVKVRFVVQDPSTRKVTHRSTKTFRLRVRR